MKLIIEDGLNIYYFISIRFDTRNLSYLRIINIVRNFVTYIAYLSIAYKYGGRVTDVSE